VEFGLLGPLMVKSGETLISIPAARQRVLLAALLVSVNRVVSADELADTLWGDCPPPTARVTVQNYVKRLRRALGDTGHSLIATRPGGYLLRVGVEELDITRFEALQGQARDAARRGEWSLASARLHRALALWRGRPLADVPCDRLAVREVPRLGELRLQALEARVDADLRLGLHDELLAELAQLVAAHPLRERLQAQLMLALYRAGRQGDALAAYRQARQVLVRQLGVEPGPELRRLHQQILTAERGLDMGSEGGGLVSTPMKVAAQQLPTVTAHFAGRQRELKMLNGLEAGARAGGTQIVIISGTAGVGKTALAVYWAHQVRRRFPDGQLYVNLRGFGPSGTPMVPTEAIRGALESLGMPAGRIPSQLDAQAALYRSLLAGKRMLVMVDNARDESQVRPLLPSAGGAMVLVTSRSRLAGLAAAEGALVLTLDVLTEAEARELMTGRLGAERTESEPAATTEVIGHCARLPLALSILAARAATCPGMTLAALAAELRDARSRLDALDTGDLACSVRAVFSWSYQLLSEPAARVFRLLSIHPGPDISLAAAATLAALPVPPARQTLRELTRAHLAEEHAPGRFTFHDLLRTYAAEKATECGSADQRQAAIHRMLDHYLHTAHRGMLLIDEKPWPLMPGPPQPGVIPEELSSRAQAMTWFTAEHHVLCSMVSKAASSRFDTHAWQLPATMWAYLSRNGRWHECLTLHRTALTAARRLGDLHAQARAHYGIGDALIKLGSCQSGRAHLQHALRLFNKLGDHAGRVRTHFGIAVAHEKQQQHRQALSHAQRGLDLCQAAGDRAGQAYALNVVGWYHARLGNHQPALRHCQLALALHRELGHRFGEGITLDSLGYICHQTGRYDQAAAYYQHALHAYADAGDHYYQAQTLIHLGETHQNQGEPEAARQSWQQALAILNELNHPEASQLRARLACAAAT
jgi:DNA-binding SARP family transcriptional activator